MAGKNIIGAFDSSRIFRRISFIQAATPSNSNSTNSVGPLAARLRSASASAEVLRGIVERQQTIKTLWSLPTPGFQRKAAEVRALEQELMLLVGGTDCGDDHDDTVGKVGPDSPGEPPGEKTAEEDEDVLLAGGAALPQQGDEPEVRYFIRPVRVVAADERHRG